MWAAYTGADGAQLFDSKQYGALICGLKLQELHPSLASKVEASAPLLVVQGPTEPTTLRFILQDLVDFFLKHDPGMVPHICRLRANLHLPPPPLQRPLHWCREDRYLAAEGGIMQRKGNPGLAGAGRRRGGHANPGSSVQLRVPCSHARLLSLCPQRDLVC